MVGPVQTNSMLSSHPANYPCSMAIKTSLLFQSQENALSNKHPIYGELTETISAVRCWTFFRTLGRQKITASLGAGTLFGSACGDLDHFQSAEKRRWKAIWLWVKTLPKGCPHNGSVMDVYAPKKRCQIHRCWSITIWIPVAPKPLRRPKLFSVVLSLVVLPYPTNPAISFRLQLFDPHLAIRSNILLWGLGWAAASKQSQVISEGYQKKTHHDAKWPNEFWKRHVSHLIILIA